ATVPPALPGSRMSSGSLAPPSDRLMLVFRSARGHHLASNGPDEAALMSATPSSRQVNWWLSFKRLFQAMPGRAGSTIVETTVDHTLMRGSEPHDR
ncbi:MAG TPA: hypothetical protein VMF32_22725, partial [Xanthobacteraceae bacterium]|nr:hypothetical protein [Xanthobacteraceae bacterium]